MKGYIETCKRSGWNILQKNLRSFDFSDEHLLLMSCSCDQILHFWCIKGMTLFILSQSKSSCKRVVWDST